MLRIGDRRKMIDENSLADCSDYETFLPML
jgi:hypothetical protein